MFFPRCGNVLVIDDKFEEAMPLLNLLGRQGVAAIYYSGEEGDLPEKPLDSVRLVFCDLKFNIATEDKSVISNIIGILKKLIDADNGPYILLIWSTHETDYLEELRAALEKEGNRPEFILPLCKSEYFETQNLNEKFFESIEVEMKKSGFSGTDIESLQAILENKIEEYFPLHQIPVNDAIKRIGDKLSEELRKVGLFHLFVLWENTINKSSGQTVNSIYRAIPDSIPQEKRLNAMLFYLAYHRLEKRMNEADEETKFESAVDSLDEMFSYFFTEAAHGLTLSQVEIDKIECIQEIRDLSDAKFNRWKMIASASKGQHPGNVYTDLEQRFQYHGLIEKKDKYAEIINELTSETGIRYILIDLSSDCDIAQQKIFLSRIVPGVMIPHKIFEKYCGENKLKRRNLPEYILMLEPIEWEAEDWCILFNVNQMCAVEMDALNDDQQMYSLTKSYVVALKQKAANCIAKQGIEVFGAVH